MNRMGTYKVIIGEILKSWRVRIRVIRVVGQLVSSSETIILLLLPTVFIVASRVCDNVCVCVNLVAKYQQEVIYENFCSISCK